MLNHGNNDSRSVAASFTIAISGTFGTTFVLFNSFLNLWIERA